MSDAPPNRFWLWAAVLLLFAVVSVQYTFKITQPSRDHGLTKSAVLRWRPQLEELLAGRDIFADHNFPNPPVMALILAPLAKLPPLAAGLTWFYLKCGLTLITLVLVFRLFDAPGRPFPLWGQAVAVVLSLRPILGDLSHGNINLFILFLIVVTLTLVRARRDFLGGIVLGLAVCCKLTPALFLPYYAWKRAWGVLAGAATGLVLFFGIVPSLYFGFETNARYFTGWVNGMVKPFVLDGKVTSEQQNQSLPGLLYRLASPNPSTSAWDEESDNYVPLTLHNVVDVPQAVLRWTLKGAMLGFALLVVWACRTPFTDRTNWRLAAEAGVVVLGMLLFSERTWKHHAVTLLLPFAALCYAWSAGWVKRPGWVIAVLTTAAVLMAATASGFVSDPSSGGKLERTIDPTQVYGAYTLAFGVLLAASLALLRLTRAARSLPVATRQAA